MLSFLISKINQALKSDVPIIIHALECTYIMGKVVSTLFTQLACRSRLDVLTTCVSKNPAIDQHKSNKCIDQLKLPLTA